MENKDTIHIFLFLLSILGVSWFFNYFEIFNYAPYGFHSWRQTDSCAFVQIYYNDGMNFFQPRVHHNMLGEGFGSPSEFPILYYISAMFWHLFQPHDGVLRLVNFFLLGVGYFSVSRLSWHLTKDLFYSIATPLLLMGSPVLAYYGFNYIPNTPALGLTFIGVLFFYYFYKIENRKWLILSCASFLFGGLLKVTVLIPFITIIIIFLLEKTNLIQFKSEGKIFKNGWKNLLLFFSVFVLIFGWIAWVKNYNEFHNCNIFITKTRPIWSLAEPLITDTWHWIIKDGAPQYYHRVTRYVVFGSAFFILFFLRKKQPKLLYIFNLFIFLGMVGTFLIFYRQFFIHDYYAIEMMVFPASVFITSFYLLKNKFPNIGNHFLTKIIITVFIMFNLNNAQKSIEKKYEELFIFNENYNPSFSKKLEARAFLNELNIKYPQKVIAIPDGSPNFSLNYFNLKGWNEYAMNEQPFKPWAFHQFRNAGAEYLIVTDEKYLVHEHLKEFIQYPLGTFENSIFVFDLRPLETKYKK
ncbi:MAG: ArnT family glycosyltransferase [Saprospiraceae bacterium]